MLALLIFAVLGNIFWTIKNAADKGRRRRQCKQAAKAKYQTAAGLDEPIQNRQEYLALIARLNHFNTSPELKEKAQRRIEEYEQKLTIIEFIKSNQSD